jgi:hypothetical protein
VALRGVTAALVVALGALLAAITHVSASPAERIPARNGDLAQLRSQDCPAFRALYEREYTRGEIAAARDGRFTIYRGLDARLDPPVNWAKNPHGRRGFRASLQTLKFLEVLIYAYRQGGPGSESALRQAKALALDWLRVNRSPGSAVNALAWFNKTVGERVPYLAYVVRAAACERMLTRGQAQLFASALRTHGEWLASPANYYPSNHGLFMDVGLLLLSDHYFPFLDGAQRWERTARSRFPRTLAARVSREGAWLEHSFGYHFLVMDLARRFLELGGGNARIRNLLARLGRAGAWFVQPDGRLAQIGDTNLEAAPRQVRRRSRRLNGMRVMPHAGYVFVRHGDSYLTVTAGFHNRSHKQSDEGSFELAEDGVRVVSGPGKYGLDHDRRRRYVISARSHSVLTVDGRSFSRDPRLSYGSAIVDARRRGDWYVIVVRNPLLHRRGVEHRRVFLYRPGDALVIVDRIDADRPHLYRRYLQLGPPREIDREGPARLSLHGGGFHGCAHEQRYGLGRLSARRTVRGRAHPFQGWTFPSVARPVPRWSVSYVSRGEDIEHTLAIDLERGCGRLDQTVGDVLQDAGDLVTEILEGLFAPPPTPPAPNP